MEEEKKTMKVGKHMHGMGSVPVAGEDRGFCAIASESPLLSEYATPPSPSSLGIRNHYEMPSKDRPTQTAHADTYEPIYFERQAKEKKKILSVTANL